MSDSSQSFAAPPFKKVVNRCLSCKKLKIKCDEAKPKCEYCEYTNRECVYPAKSVGKKRIRKLKTEQTIGKIGEIEQISSWQVELWNNQRCLNSTTRQLGVSHFELRLLHYFHEHYVQLKDANPINKVWRVEVPKLWQKSDVVRQSVFALSAMHLWSFCDLTALIQEDLMDTDSYNMTFLNNVNCSELYLHPNNLKAFLFDKTGEYFTNCLIRTNSMMSAIINQEYVVTTVFQAAEIVISGILLFSFLALQPHGLVPLLSYDAEIPDLISMCKGMKLSMSYAFPLLINSPFGGLSHLNEKLDPPVITEKDRYPLIEHLRDELEKKKLIDGFLTNEYKILKGEIDLLEVDFYRTIESSDPLPIYRWIFLVDIKFYDLVKKDMNPFALKLLFLYTCLCVMCKFRIDKKTNIWLNFIDWYRNYNFTFFGKWNDSFDEEMYEVVMIKNFEIEGDSYDLLETFVPHMYT